MNAQQLTDKLATLKVQRPVTVLGAAVIDVIAAPMLCPGAGVISNCSSRASMSAAAR